MCYYTFKLDNASQELCTIITPFGKLADQRLAMELTCALTIAKKSWRIFFVILKIATFSLTTLETAV